MDKTPSITVAIILYILAGMEHIIILTLHTFSSRSKMQCLFCLSQPHIPPTMPSHILSRALSGRHCSTSVACTGVGLAASTHMA